MIYKTYTLKSKFDRKLVNPFTINLLKVIWFDYCDVTTGSQKDGYTYSINDNVLCVKLLGVETFIEIHGVTKEEFQQDCEKAFAYAFQIPYIEPNAEQKYIWVHFKAGGSPVGVNVDFQSFFKDYQEFLEEQEAVQRRPIKTKFSELNKLDLDTE